MSRRVSRGRGRAMASASFCSSSQRMTRHLPELSVLEGWFEPQVSVKEGQVGRGVAAWGNPVLPGLRGRAASS
jgi:hypothetical protein